MEQTVIRIGCRSLPMDVTSTCKSKSALIGELFCKIFRHFLSDLCVILSEFSSHYALVISTFSQELVFEKTEDAFYAKTDSYRWDIVAGEHPNQVIISAKQHSLIM